MSEEKPTPEASEEAPKEKKKPKKNHYGMGSKVRSAVIEVLEREKKGLPPRHKQVAARYHIKASTLNTTVWKVKNGLATIDTADAASLHIDAQQMTQITDESLNEVESMLVVNLQEMIPKAKKFAADGKHMAYRDVGIMQVVSDIAKIRTLRMINRRQMLELWKEAQREREAKAAIADVPAEKIEQVQDEVTAKRLMREELARMQDAEFTEGSPASHGTEIPANPSQILPETDGPSTGTEVRDGSGVAGSVPYH